MIGNNTNYNYFWKHFIQDKLRKTLPLWKMVSALRVDFILTKQNACEKWECACMSVLNQYFFRILF